MTPTFAENITRLAAQGQGSIALDAAQQYADVAHVHMVLCLTKDGTVLSKTFEYDVPLEDVDHYVEHVCPVASLCEFKCVVWA